MAQYRLSLSNFGWRGRVALVLATAVGLAAALALIVLALGFALVLVPLVAAAFVLGRWRLKKAMDAAARSAAEHADAGKTIEIEYHVIDYERAGPKR